MAVVLTLLWSCTAKVNISGTAWSDDFASDTSMDDGWFQFSGSDSNTSVFAVTNGDTQKYHLFSRAGIATSDKHQYLSRYFQCEYDSWVQVSMSIAQCGGGSADHFRVYDLGYKKGTSALYGNYSELTLDELTTNMTTDGTMNSSFTNSDAGPCDDWKYYYQMDLTYNLSVGSGDEYESTVDANTTFELYLKWKFADDDQFGLLWNLELTCNAVSSHTSYVHVHCLCVITLHSRTCTCIEYVHS